ncbi:MAG: ABC transporter substrate-binding protein [Bacteroidetes bacterium]|nr:ABC transporter substrate-binding protein [Bacteroidota bacterium]
MRIGISLGLTGDYALTSNKQNNAYKLFQDTLNSSGGVLNKSIEFLIKDNKSLASLAIEQYEDLITKDKVDFVIGPYTSGLTLAISPVIEKHGYPTLAARAAADSIWQKGYKNIFGMWTPASRYLVS